MLNKIEKRIAELRKQQNHLGIAVIGLIGNEDAKDVKRMLEKDQENIDSQIEELNKKLEKRYKVAGVILGTFAAVGVLATINILSQIKVRVNIAE